MTTNDRESEIKTWLEMMLEDQNLDTFSIKIEGNSEKGDGYMGDIIFLEVNGITKEGINKDYSLVLKCAKRSTALRKKSPIREAFLNEITFYGTIFPRFVQFQREKNVDDPFNKVPKCYGTLVTDEIEVLALENLKRQGYFLWERTRPLTRKHINLMIKEYAKYHAVSIAMKHQRPDEFDDLAGKFEDVIAKFMHGSEMTAAQQEVVDEVYDLLESELEADVLRRWRDLKNQVGPIFEKASQTLDVMNVITHGDCWINNFLHLHDADNEPSTFAMLDWQLIKYSSPIYDLSYFLFACLSKEDMDDLDNILALYHQTLGNHLRKLGSDNPEQLYPLEQFLREWKELARYGIAMTMVTHKYSLSEKDDVPDMVRAAENGEDMMRTFTQPIKNTAAYKKRMSYIVKYVVEHDLI